MTLELQTERLILRRPNRNDWLAYHDFMMSDRAIFFSSHGDLAKIWRSFTSEIGHWDMYDCGMWIITRHGDDLALGMTGPWLPPHWPEREIGWMIFASDVEGTGIAAEAANAAVAHAFNTLGWDTAVSYIDPDNTRSIALAQKLGASHDDTAVGPTIYPDTLVYRHPAPKGAAA